MAVDWFQSQWGHFHTSRNISDQPADGGTAKAVVVQWRNSIHSIIPFLFLITGFISLLFAQGFHLLVCITLSFTSSLMTLVAFTHLAPGRAENKCPPVVVCAFLSSMTQFSLSCVNTALLSCRTIKASQQNSCRFIWRGYSCGVFSVCGDRAAPSTFSLGPCPILVQQIWGQTRGGRGGDDVDMLHLCLLVTCTNNTVTLRGPSRCCAMSSGVLRRSRKLCSPPPGSFSGGFVILCLGVRGQQCEDMLGDDRWCRREPAGAVRVAVQAMKQARELAC